MKTVNIYVCETCGKRFDNLEEATKCERSHQAEKERKALKEKSEGAINQLINQHIKTFGEIPEIKISDDSLSKIGEEFKFLYKLLTR